MTVLHRLASIVRWIARRDRAERDLDDEMRTFVEMAAADAGDGQTPAEARRLALLRLGGLEQAKERVRAGRHGAWLDEFGRDIRQAVRQARRNPAFSAAAITTLALGIGATVAVYSLVHAVLLRPLPYGDPDRLVRIESRNVGQGGALQGVSVPDLDDFRQRARTLTGIGTYATVEDHLLGDVTAVVWRTSLNPDVMNLLGVRAQLGRLLTPEDDQPGGDVYTVVISDSLWSSHFGGDPNVIGQVLRTDDASYTVVGVMPPGFAFPDQTSMWVPAQSQLALLPPERRVRRRTARFNSALARIAPGITLAQAEADLNSVAAVLETEYPKENAGVRVKLTALREFETGELRPYLYLLLAGVAMITLTCCANVAGLQLVRGMNRQREVAVQAALGAGRGRLVRQRLAESAVLAAAGGALGVGLAVVIIDLMLALIPIGLPFWMAIRIDGAVLAFAVILTAATCVVFGVMPALRATQVDAGATLKAGARLASTGGRLQSALVVGEVSFSVLLLVCAALLMQTFDRLQRIDPGFTPEGLVTARVLMDAPPGPVPQHAAIVGGAHARMLDVIRRQPGVTAAAVTSALPFTGTQTERPEEPLVLRGQVNAEVVAPLSGADVSPDYFRAMGIQLRRGRLFDESDALGAPHVVVINERAARTLWPARDALGQEMVWGVPSAVNPYARVVGIVADVRHQAAERDNGIELYYPLAQFPVRQGHYVVRVAGDPHAMADTIRRTIETSDKTMAVAEVKSMDQQVDESLWQRRLWGALFAGFGALALLVAAVGLYGTISYTVAQRTRELGIRVALGDRPARMGGMIVREGMTLVAGGVAIGIVAALGAGRLIAGLLHGVPAHDPFTLAAVALVIFAAGLVALVMPARRASRIDPLVALRTD